MPPARIAEAAEEIRALLAEHGFLSGVAGHASAGNLHFMLTPDFAKPEDVERYETFMASSSTSSSIGYDGSLKAEHGTGVNMAPFVEREWGRDRDRDDVADSRGSPTRPASSVRGSSSTAIPDCHLEDLKTTPPIEEVATTCVECGFCEPVCPSRDLTTTPRQRIVLRREMARQPAGSPLLAKLIEEYEYDGLRDLRGRRDVRDDLPARDRHRRARQGAARGRAHEREERAALRAAQRWDRVEAGARSGLAAWGSAISRAIGERGHGAGSPPPPGRRSSAELVPDWEPPMPPPAETAMPPTVRDGAAAVYLPSCINRMFGRDPGELRRRPRPRGAAVAAGGARRRLAPGRAAGLDPDRRRR